MSRPRLKLGPHLAKGVGAIALFVILAYLVLRTTFPEVVGFPDGVNITASIGYALFNLPGGDVASEGFLAPFEIIDIVLVAALVGAVMLARRRVGGQVAAALRTGGEEE